MSLKLSSASGSTPPKSASLAANGGQPVSPRLVPIARVKLEESEVEQVAAVLRSGNLREGRICQEFEQRFADLTGARHSVTVSSGTAALHVAYAAYLKPGDEVLVPAFTFFATASMAVMVGARPVFCDVDPVTFNLDVADARRRITPGARAIAPVHLFGNPCDVAGIRQLAAEFNLKIIWDAAQAHGAEYGERDIGSLDDASCYSFYPTKNMTTAEGGMITTNDEAIYRWCKLFRSHGQSGKYYHSMLGMNYRLTDVMAKLGLLQLDKLSGWVAQRRANATFLTKALAGTPGVQLPVEQSGGASSWHQYSVVLDLDRLACSRDEFVNLLQAEGIGAAVHYPRPLHRQPAFAKLVSADYSLPVSEALSERILSIPVHPYLTSDELQLVAAGVRKVAEACAR